MDLDLGISFGSTNKRLRMNGPSQSTDRNGQLDNNIGSSLRGNYFTIKYHLWQAKTEKQKY